MTQPVRPLTMTRAVGLLALLGLAGCDFVIVVLAILFIGPLYPGKPQPPAPSPDCPITVPVGSVAPSPGADELPDDLRRDDVVVDCSIPEKPALARQNRDELERSLQALTGVDAGLRFTLPPDTTGAGLDVIAELHAVSPLLVERLEQAAHDVVDRAMRLPGDAPTSTVVEAEGAVGVFEADNGFVRLQGSSLTVPVLLSLPGTWALRVRLAPVPVGDEAPRLVLRLDGDEILRTDLRGNDGDAVVIEVRHALLAEGRAFQPVHRLEVVHDNGFKQDGQHRALLVDSVEVVGPFDPPSRGPLTSSRERLVHCDLAGTESLDGESCATEVLQMFAWRAWRGQVTDDDVRRLQGLLAGELAAGDDVETALKTAMAAVLLSPRFLFRLELDTPAGFVVDAPAPGVRPLTDHELAARLAAFLWSSAPDDRLLELAQQGALRDERVLVAEATRMLDDPRSTVIVERFFAAWLGLEALDHARPDPERFETFDEDLRTSMRCEAELLVDRVLRSGGGVDELLLSQTGAINHPLARHYGLPPPDLDDDTSPARGGYVDTSLAGTHRQGLLGTGAVLTMTSQPTRTSPTRRGKWVLERLMCTTPPPPPPGVEGLVESVAGEEPAQSVRQLLEQHRADPSCAGCHDFIDPMGLPLERFDGVGRLRGSDGAFAIDDSALWLGDPNDPVRGSAELAQRLADDELVDRCLSQRALSYGTGILMDDDHDGGCAIDAVAARTAARGGRLSDVLVEVVMSPAFRARTITDVAFSVDVDESTFEPRGAR